ncbi:GtrA family protein [Amnibacterium flavum]|uniref:GtrA family protein n=2 Tax=Amnibacterium flavum TaxID=2173173 RepID=A0A2V1HX66_9MICO|nr:GtrA family protein [Amnibacterium flavum]
MTRSGSFAAIGLLAFVVDIGVYNALRFTVLDDKPIGAKVISVAVAMVVAWIGNRYLTFRDARNRPLWQEAGLFTLANLLGLGASAACLFTSHYLLGLTSPLADNISGNVIGLAIGTVVRFVAYRYVVFPDRGRDTAAATAVMVALETAAPHDPRESLTDPDSTAHERITHPETSPAFPSKIRSEQTL